MRRPRRARLRLGEPERRLDSSRITFSALGLTPLADRCDRLMQNHQPATPTRRDASRKSELRLPGITSREGEVLTLLVERLANKEIAAPLHLSPARWRSTWRA